MELRNITIESHGISIHAGFVIPKLVKGVVVLVHGFGEHSGRYLNGVLPAMVEAGCAVVFYDNFGHGRSGGKRGHCPSYEALLELLDVIIDHAKSKFGNQLLFLYGHSMGGNLVLNYALRNKTEIKGIIASSPYLRLGFQPPKWKMVLGKVMLKFWSSITLPAGLDPNGISRIPEEVARYKTDPLVHDKVSPMYSFPIMDAGKWAIANAAALKINTLLLHGTGDPIIDYEGTKEFHENSSGRTSLRLFDGGYHELHHDLCHKEVLQAIQSWLRQQL